MSGNKLPVTPRDFFSQDQYFRDSWNGFNRLQEAMIKEQEDMWNRIEKNFKSVARCLSQDEEANKAGEEKAAEGKEKAAEGKSDEASKEQNGKQAEDKTAESNGHAANGSLESKDRWIFPRQYMLPILADQDFHGEMGLYQTPGAADLIRYRDDDSQLEISLDTHHFKPKELHVRQADGMLTIEGKHEEQNKDGSRHVSKSFIREYSLPKEAQAEKIECNLSTDGVLVIHVPKKAAEEIPIKEA